MCWECETGRDTFCDACFVSEGGVGFEDELVADREFAVGDGVRYCDSVAGRVTIPVFVLLGRVAKVVDLVGRVVSVNVNGHAVDGAMDLVG